jgi:NADH:ubiquinone oxidoreductase subunit E
VTPEIPAKKLGNNTQVEAGRTNINKSKEGEKMEAKTQCRCELSEELDKIIAQHEGKKDDLIEVLHWVQENYRYIPKDVQVKIAEKLNVPYSTVYGVVTFYHFFSLKPKGRYEIALCQGTACYVKGSPKVLEKFEEELAIGAQQTTADGMFSLEVVRCLGACGLAPVITVNKEPRARLKPEHVPEIINELKSRPIL